MPSVVAEVGQAANNYQVLAKLATGGMAEIFLARGASVAGVERYVVLKRILRERATDTHFVQMFLEEARLAAQLNHPHVAQVYDIGKLGDSYFFTMEYVHGETVRALLHRARSLRREIPIGNIVTTIANAAAGLHHAHERIGIDGRPLGIVHRDVSPSNLMISYEGSVKLVDFGVAKAENRASETRSGQVKGKISYLSPEQCRGSAVDRRSDLFSLGIVFWEMLTTERLYRRESDFANMHAIVTEPPPPPSSRRPGVSPEIDAIVLKLLAKHPDERFQTGDELVEALEEVAARSNVQISPSALSRFLRELFGQRPEPWVEMEQAAPEGVTVTSEPIPPDLLKQLDPVDMSLARVPNLSSTQEAFSGSQSHSNSPPPAPPSAAMTIPMVAPAASDVLQTLPLRGRPSTSSPPLTASNPSLSGPVPVPISGSNPSLSGPIPSISNVPHSQSGYPIAQQAWLSPPVDHQNVAIGMPPKTKRMIAIGGGVIVLLTIVAAIAASGGDDAPPKQAAQVPVDAAIVDAATATAPIVVDAVAMAVDAPPPIDAAPPVDAVIVDAAPEPLVVDAAVASPSQQIADAFAAGEFGDVVALCARNLVSETAVACTVAACRLGDATKARTAFGKVRSSKRAEVTAACKQRSIDLAPRTTTQPKQPKEPDCNADPMACQR